MVCVTKHQLFHDVAYILPCGNKCVNQSIQVTTLSTEGHFLSPEQRQSATVVHIEATPDGKMGEQRIKPVSQMVN